ncbi:hypothetical protein JTE90_014231 [Oedothorax gibbosus]|uniref:Uncharacterized protein n=1 Tax=Oedothorax gibbosus TaxID=931172 RepID=A0AAV6TSK9_9ARAC|nr:hypothetical protein JTE90_014231 [Oedothorax gibbosus]
MNTHLKTQHKAVLQKILTEKESEKVDDPPGKSASSGPSTTLPPTTTTGPPPKSNFFALQTTASTSRDQARFVDTSTIEVSAPEVDFAEPEPKRRKKQLRLFGGNSPELTNSAIAEIDLALVKMIARDFQPLSIVENKEFLEYTQKLNPMYTHQTVKKITKELIPHLYQIVGNNWWTG